MNVHDTTLLIIIRSAVFAAEQLFSHIFFLEANPQNTAIYDNEIDYTNRSETVKSYYPNKLILNIYVNFLKKA